MSTAPQQTISQLLHDVAMGSAYHSPEKESRAKFEIEQRFAALEQDAKNWQDWRENAKKGGLRIDSYWRTWFDALRADAAAWQNLTAHSPDGSPATRYGVLVADANRFALLRMVSLEPNEALRDLMLDAMDRIVAANDAENKPLTAENFNDTFDTAIVECNRIRSEHANGQT
jgi:hypothetical protein